MSSLLGDVYKRQRQNRPPAGDSTQASQAENAANGNVAKPEQPKKVAKPEVNGNIAPAAETKAPPAKKRSTRRRSAPAGKRKPAEVSATGSDTQNPSSGISQSKEISVSTAAVVDNQDKPVSNVKADNPAASLATSRNATTDKAPAEKPATKKPSADKTLAENAAADKSKKAEKAIDKPVVKKKKSVRSRKPATDAEKKPASDAIKEKAASKPEKKAEKDSVQKKTTLIQVETKASEKSASK